MTTLIAFLVSIVASMVLAQPSAAAVVNRGTVKVGTPVTGKVAVAGQDIQYSFAATQGHHLTVNITATSWKPGTAYLHFYNPTGSRQYYCQLTATPRSCDFTPNATGTWTRTRTIKLDPTGDTTGRMTMVLV